MKQPYNPLQDDTDTTQIAAASMFTVYASTAATDTAQAAKDTTMNAAAATNTAEVTTSVTDNLETSAPSMSEEFKSK